MGLWMVYCINVGLHLEGICFDIKISVIQECREYCVQMCGVGVDVMSRDSPERKREAREEFTCSAQHLFDKTSARRERPLTKILSHTSLGGKLI